MSGKKIKGPTKIREAQVIKMGKIIDKAKLDRFHDQKSEDMRWGLVAAGEFIVQQHHAITKLQEDIAELTKMTAVPQQLSIGGTIPDPDKFLSGDGSNCKHSMVDFVVSLDREKPGSADSCYRCIDCGAIAQVAI